MITCRLARQLDQRHLRQAINPHRRDRCAHADRGVTSHAVMAPQPGAQTPRQFRAQRDRDGARQTDLAAMGMPAQHQVEAGMRSLPIDLRRVRQQDRERIRRDVDRGFLDVVDSVEMGIVDTGEMDVLAAVPDRLALIEQHPDSHRLEVRHHTDAVMVAQHAIDRSAQRRAQSPDAVHGGFDRPERGRPVIAGQHAQVVAKFGQDRGEPAHRAIAVLDVEITDVQQGEAIECGRQICKRQTVTANLDALGIAPAPPVQSRQLQRAADQRMSRAPVLDMEKGQSLAEDLRLMIHLDTEPLPGMEMPETPFQAADDIVHGGSGLILDGGAPYDYGNLPLADYLSWHIAETNGVGGTVGAIARRPLARNQWGVASEAWGLLRRCEMQQC